MNGHLKTRWCSEFLPHNLECKNKDLCNVKNITEEMAKFNSYINIETSYHLKKWRHAYNIQCFMDKDKNGKFSVNKTRKIA